MEKRKKGDLPHWVTPGVFSGHFVVDEAVERISIVKPVEKAQEAVIGQVPKQPADEKPDEEKQLVLEPAFEIIMRETDVATSEQLEKLEQEVAALKESLAAWEKRWKKAEEEQSKERQHLYQVVLSLKKEWESERNEHRHN
ncbi:hypothetical protein [Brevibacillus parabrevis]|uniref:hypothetical protein n=1 Tax=Brevibacillus parabrevis TaxID=54914 RepID=UPI0028D354F3|nr:hypothetical protein [Brevibacillus parabrevis]